MKKHIFILLILILTFFSCLKKLYKKQLDNEDIKVNWYFYSDITHSSMDFVEIVRNDSIVLVAKVFPGLDDLELRNDSIIIYLEHFDILTEGEVRNIEKVFDYHIVYRQVDSP